MNKILKRNIFHVGLLIIIFIFSQCAKDPVGLISSENEKNLGNYLDSTLLIDTITYKIVNTTDYSNSYKFLDTIFTAVLRSDEVLRNYIGYTVRIIDDKEVNLFSFPGGYYYINTGLIKYLDNSAELAGIVAHQIAHSDRRHLTENIESEFGIDALLDISVYGKQDNINAIFNFLTDGIIYSGGQESDADEYAMRYTADTEYDVLGIYSVLQKMNNSVNRGSSPKFVSGHPIRAELFEEMLDTWAELDSIEGDLFINQYRNFKNGLP